MRKIDAHQHFWRFDPLRDSWITEDMQAIRRDFLPADLQPLLQENGFDGCVTVQSDQSLQENEFQLQNAEGHSFIKGVVGWVDLKAADLSDQLDRLKGFPKLKGFRHVLQAEHPDFMLDERFLHGIKTLGDHGYTYDILVFPQHLVNAEKLVGSFPNQRFVLDHIAKPLIKAGDIDAWEKDIRALAKHPQVYCKVSGMVTEADWKGWQPQDFTRYLDVVFDAFGSRRLMFGSDWPVCLVAASYRQVVELADNYCSRLSSDEQSAFWAGNAETFYNLSM